MAKIKAKRRAIYNYICKKCHKKRASLIYNRAVNKECTLCRKNRVAENQQALF